MIKSPLQFIVRHPLREKLLLLTGVLSTVLFVSPVSAQSVVYRETFYSTVNNDTLNHADPALGWHFDKSATGAIGGTVTNGDGVSTRSGLNGEPIDLPAINAGTYAGTDQGIMFTTAGDARQGLFYTNEYTALSSQDITQISWYAANSSALVTQQAAVQVNGSWFVSNTTFSTAALSGAAFGSNTAVQETLLFSGSQWKTLSYTVGSAGFSISSTADVLPSGNVSGFGLFVDTANAGNPRFDTFEITAIPEPSSYAAVLGLAALGLTICRRRHLRRGARASTE